MITCGRMQIPTIVVGSCTPRHVNTFKKPSYFGKPSNRVPMHYYYIVYKAATQVNYIIEALIVLMGAFIENI